MVETPHPTPREYHYKIGGRKVEDLRFINIDSAVNARSLILRIREKTHLPNKRLANILGTNGSTVSRLTYGSAGETDLPGRPNGTTVTLTERLLILADLADKLDQETFESVRFEPIFKRRR